MKRIAIVGSSGAGKTTLALALSDKLNIPVIHLDKHYWLPGWQKRPGSKWLDIQTNLLKADSWIVDGNYSSTLNLRISKADTVLLLDYPRALCTCRALKRVFQYRKNKRPDMAEGCHEHLDWDFIKYIWTFPEKLKPKILETLKQHQDKDIRVFKNDQETKLFLEGITG